MREPPVKVRDTQHTPFYISDSSWMNSEIFANRLLLWLSVLRFQSDIFRNIHKETTFRLFCDSSQMNSEIFTKRPLFRLCSVIQIGWIQKYSQRLLLGLSVLWLQSDEFRNIHRLFLGLCSVIPVTSVQKYSLRDYFSDSVLWFESDEFRNIHKETTFRTLFCDLNWINEFRNIHKEITFRTLCSVLLWLRWYVQLRHSRHSLSFAC